MNVYLKAIIHSLFAVAVLLVPLLANGHVSNKEWVNVGIVAAGSVGVYWAANIPGSRFVKQGLAAVVAGLTVLSTFIGGTHGVPTVAWVQVILAVAAALGVAVFPNGEQNVV